jgi:uncharacterized protein (UPF0216 family)
MRKLLCAAWMAVVVSGVAGKAPAPGEETPQAVIERAIKAHGGQDRLSRVKADRVKSRGTLFIDKLEVPFSAETTVQMPAQIKNVIHFAPDQKRTLVQILNGDKAFVTLDGQPQKIEQAALNEMREILQLERAIRLVPLLTDKSFELAPLGESKVNERTVVGVKVSVKGRKDLRLYFDRESGLLAKSEFLLDDMAGKEVRQDVYYSEFKEFEGFKRATRLSAFRDGKKVMDAEVGEVKYLDKLDDDEFKP